MASPKREDPVATVDLHRDVVFTLLLEVDPKELNSLCRSHRKFANVCKEPYFQEMYKAKWSKRIYPYEEILAKLQAIDPAQFARYTVEQLRAMKKLRLHHIQGITIFPPEICSLVNLEELTLEKCDFGVLPPQISNLASLRDLHLEKLPALRTLPGEIGDLANLTQLAIYKCSHFTALPVEIGNLAKLEILEIVYCPITKIPPAIGNLSSLVTINFGGSTVKTLPKELLGLPKLVDIAITQNSSNKAMIAKLRLKGVTVTKEF